LEILWTAESAAFTVAGESPSLSLSDSPDPSLADEAPAGARPVRQRRVSSRAQILKNALPEELK